MKPSVNNSKSNQPKTLSRREGKKRVNTVSHEVLYFQIGLIVSLLAAIFAVEAKFSHSLAKYSPGISIEDPSTYVFVLEEPEPAAPIRKTPQVKTPVVKQPVVDIVDVVPVPDDKPIIETPTKPTDGPIVKDPPTVKVVEPKVNNGPVGVNFVEFVPVFPGCESLSTNAEKRACMSSKIGAFIQRKFKTDKFGHLDDKGKQKIYVQFKIDANGNVVDVKARAKHESLEKEAEKVVGKLPQMEPGRQGDLKVPVIFSIPISFQIE